ncbi:hypothetical protein [Alienimonas chondri]|uniref:Secreted protein n=1 Tax=Alienimonas chondri TaxID=2681879 RepID=A0ABX1VFJ0_9PLAN|nr:hypothetical protein [Alienimonas chondri]NNJ26583.1 hypothetical protein [Alienimonas chondri]
MTRYHRLHAASSTAALLGAAVVLVGCDDMDEDLKSADGRLQTNGTALDAADDELDFEDLCAGAGAVAGGAIDEKTSGAMEV